MALQLDFIIKIYYIYHYDGKFIMIIQEFGNIIKFHRKVSGLSRVELAKIAGVGKSVIYDIENGKESFKINTILKILKVLNIQITVNSPIMKEYIEQKNEKS